MSAASSSAGGSERGDCAAAQGQDDTLGVVWDKPDGRGGWISEASCWVEGCHVRVEGYDREEVERLMADHHKTFHGGTDADS